MILSRILGRPQRPVAEPPPPPVPEAPYTHPFPTLLLVSYENGATAIARGWEPGAPEQCRLCPDGTCSATPANFCLVSVPTHVEAEDLSMFSIRSYNASSAIRRGR